MKKLLLLVAFFFVGFTVATLDDTLKTLKITRADALDYVRSSISSGGLIYPVSASKIVEAKRIQIIRDMIMLARNYTDSREFVTWWTQFRLDHKPIKHEIPSPLDVQSEQVHNLEIEIARLRAERDSLPPEQRKQMDESIKQMTATAEGMKTIDPQRDSIMRMAFHHIREETEADYQQQLAEWNRRFPENGKLYIKTLLEEYLSLVPSVNFTAHTKTRSDGMIIFVEDEYEQKSYRWKLCYRAGHAVNDAAMPLVREWLRDINR